MEATINEREMTSEEIEAHLGQLYLANLATLRSDGSPQVSPVWYEYDGQKLLVIADKSTAKTHNIRRDARIMLSIPTPTEPYKYVLIEGTAKVTEIDVDKVTISICIRYRGQSRGTEFARELLADGSTVVIEVTPNKMISWVYEG